jgi:MFS family permease
MSRPAARLRYLRAPLSQPAFRRLWVSQVVSEIGDWASRLTLTSLVYQRSGSALWSSLAFVATLLPEVGVGPILATYADRFGRRAAMVAADLLRAALFLLLALPLHLPLVALPLIGVLAGMCGAPFSAARAAVLIEVVDRTRLPAALALDQATQSATIIGGYLVGGALLAVTGPSAAMGVNAASYVVSAVVLIGLPKARRASPPPTPDAAALGPITRLRVAADALRHDQVVAPLVLLATVAVATGTAVEALVIPTAHRSYPELPWLASAVLVAMSLTDLFVTVHLPSEERPERQLPLAAALSIGTCVLAVPLLLSAAPAAQLAGFIVVAGLFVVLVPATVGVGPRLPEPVRASAFALLAALLAAAQVVLSFVAAVLADLTSPTIASGLLCLLPATLATTLWYRHSTIRATTGPREAGSLEAGT